MGCKSETCRIQLMCTPLSSIAVIGRHLESEDGSSHVTTKVG